MIRNVVNHFFVFIKLLRATDALIALRMPFLHSPMQLASWLLLVYLSSYSQPAKPAATELSAIES